MKKIKYLFLPIALILVLGSVTETLAAPNYVKTREQLRQFFGIPLDLKPAGVLNQIIVALDQNKLAMQKELASLQKPVVTFLSAQAIGDTDQMGPIYGDNANFRITFKVRSDAEDIYIATDSARINGLNPWDKVAAYAIQSNGVDVSAGTAESSIYSSGASDNGYYKIARGTDSIFSLEVSYKPATDGVFRLRFDSIGYKNSANIGSRVQLPPDIFKTDYVTSRAPKYPVATIISTDSTLTTNAGPNDDIGLFTIRFKVRANNADAYIPAVNNRNFYIYSLEKNGTVLPYIPPESTAVTVDSNATKTATGNYIVRVGEEKEFSVRVAVKLGTLTAGQYRLILNYFRWSETDGPLSSAVWFVPLDGNVFRTNYLNLASNTKETQVANIQEAIRVLLEQLKNKI